MIKLEKVYNKLGLIAILKRRKKCYGSRHATEPAVKQSVEIDGHNKTTLDFPEKENDASNNSVYAGSFKYSVIKTLLIGSKQGLTYINSNGPSIEKY